MKRSLLLIISIVLTLGLACPAYGATVDDFEGALLENDLPASEGWIQPGDFSPYASATASLVFKKISTTSCKAQAVASRNWGN